MSAVEQVIERSGGIGALAKALGISPQAVHKWREAGIPIERVLELERISGVPREDQRPDFFRKPPSITTAPNISKRKRA